MPTPNLTNSSDSSSDGDRRSPHQSEEDTPLHKLAEISGASCAKKFSLAPNSANLNPNPSALMDGGYLTSKSLPMSPRMRYNIPNQLVSNTCPISVPIYDPNNTTTASQYPLMVHQNESSRQIHPRCQNQAASQSNTAARKIVSGNASQIPQQKTRQISFIDVRAKSVAPSSLTSIPGFSKFTINNNNNSNNTTSTSSQTPQGLSSSASVPIKTEEVKKKRNISLSQSNTLEPQTLPSFSDTYGNPSTNNNNNNIAATTATTTNNANSHFAANLSPIQSRSIDSSSPMIISTPASNKRRATESNVVYQQQQSHRSYLSPLSSESLSVPPPAAEENCFVTDCTHQIELLEKWLPVLELLPLQAKETLWDICHRVPGFRRPHSSTFYNAIAHWKSSVASNLVTISIFFTTAKLLIQDIDTFKMLSNAIISSAANASNATSSSLSSSFSSSSSSSSSSFSSIHSTSSPYAHTGSPEECDLQFASSPKRVKFDHLEPPSSRRGINTLPSFPLRADSIELPPIDKMSLASQSMGYDEMNLSSHLQSFQHQQYPQQPQQQQQQIPPQQAGRVSRMDVSWLISNN